MFRRVMVAAALLCLAGCDGPGLDLGMGDGKNAFGPAEAAAPAPAPMMDAKADYPDTKCAETARSRAADATANGVDAQIVERVFRDSYDTCRRLAGSAAMAAANPAR